MRFWKIEATGGFFLLMAWLNYLDHQFLLPMTVLACALHELGHYGMLWAVGGKLRLIRLTAVGAEMVIEHPLNYWQEGMTALAGPLVNLLLLLLFCGRKNGVTFAGINLVLALFNLLPISRLDGGRVLKCALSLIVGPETAESLGNRLDCLCALLLLTGGIYAIWKAGNITLLIVSFWATAAVVKQHRSTYG